MKTTIRTTTCGLGEFLLLLIIPLILPLSACNQNGNSTANCMYIEDGFGPDGEVPVRAETVVSGLEVPWAIAFLPGGDMLVTERPGRLRLVKDYQANPQLTEGSLLAVSPPSTSEGGLLGIALHPDFEENNLFYLYLTVDNAGEMMNQVEQWRLSNDRTSAERVKVIFDGIAAASNHNGGRIAFGPDGMLYIGTGDASIPENSQEPGNPNGKLLRLTPEGEIPADNPRVGNPLWIMGIRNTQGWGWPDVNDAGTLWLVDHGPSGEMMRFGHDEVNVVSVNGNLGWPDIYGCEDEQGMIPPVITWNDAVPPGGAAIYSGEAIPEWKGSLIIATLGSRHLHRVVIQNGSVVNHEVYFRNEAGRLREVMMGPDGNLYVTTSNCDGRGDCPEEGDKILRIIK